MSFPVWKDKCAHCGAVNVDPQETHYRLQCPTCARDGCEAPMPLGRGCECPECEDLFRDDGGEL